MSASALSVACPVCGAPTGRACETADGQQRKKHPERKARARIVASLGQKPRERSGKKGYRLTYTRVTSPEIRARQRKARAAQPVTVTYADGTTELRAPGSFRKSDPSGSAAAGR